MKSQRLIVLLHLIKHGTITTEQARRYGITRLPVMIQRLRKQGYEIWTINNGLRHYKIEDRHR